MPTTALPQQRSTEQSPTERFRSDALWAAAQTICVGNSVDPAIVTSRQEMSDFYQAIASKADLSDSRLMKGWRREALGEPLVKLVEGSLKLDLKWSAGSLRTS